MSSASPLPSALAVSLSAASLLVAASHWQPQWTSPRAPQLLLPTTMPSTLPSLHPQPMMKTSTSARWWRSKVCALAHLRTVPVNPSQPPCCCHCAAAVALCATAALRAATTAADSAAVAKLLLPSCRQRRAVALPPRRHQAAAATALLPSHCAPPPSFALPPLPCHSQASTNVAL